jgi:hypothetical protein
MEDGANSLQNNDEHIEKRWLNKYTGAYMVS